MKKNRIITMSLREIKKSKKRFFSLCVLSIIGVSFFSGMKMSGPTMLESLDKYYDNNKMYDMKVISTLGLEDEDVEEIQKLNNKYTVLGSHTKDAIFNDGKYESVLRMHEINKDMNNIILIKGRMPEKYNEIVVEDGIEFKTDYNIGDKIKLELEDDKSIKTDELEIVGIAISPEYLNNNELTIIDLSKNKELRTLYLKNNQLSSISLDNNNKLEIDNANNNVSNNDVPLYEEIFKKYKAVHDALAPIYRDCES